MTKTRTPEYNEVTGTPAGAPLKGAVYEISEVRSGKVVDYITTDACGVAASTPLPLGRYKIVKVTPPAYWKLSGTTFDETLEYSGRIIKISDYDKPSNLTSTSSYAFNLNAIPTQAGEKVTEIYFDFGKVPVGFQSVTSPTLSVVVSGNIANGYQMMNRADAGGKYQGAWQTAQAYWVTIVRKLDNRRHSWIKKKTSGGGLAPGSPAAISASR